MYCAFQCDICDMDYIGYMYKPSFLPVFAFCEQQYDVAHLLEVWLCCLSDVVQSSWLQRLDVLLPPLFWVQMDDGIVRCDWLNGNSIFESFCPFSLFFHDFSSLFSSGRKSSYSNVLVRLMHQFVKQIF